MIATRALSWLQGARRVRGGAGGQPDRSGRWDGWRLPLGAAPPRAQEVKVGRAGVAAVGVGVHGISTPRRKARKSLRRLWPVQ